MLEITRTYRWANCLACLAIAIGVAGAFAQQDQDEAQTTQQQSNDEPSQAQHRNQEQQPRQSDQQLQDRDRQQWDEGDDRQRPAREGQYGRDDWSGEEQHSDRERDRASQHRFRSGNQEAGLGVSVAADEPGNIRVIRVHRGSPAQEMGIREGDEITHLNGRRVQTTSDFISRIRNMEPGEEVELEIRRDSQDRTIRGELESRREALVLRGRGENRWSWPEERSDARQSGYEEGPRFSRHEPSRSGEVDRQIGRIERQLNQLSRELEELRFAVRDLRDQSGRWSRETTARYEEYGSREGTRTDGRRSYRDGREFGSERGPTPAREWPQEQRGPYEEGARSRSYEPRHESPGGETGEERLHPDNEFHDRD